MTISSDKRLAELDAYLQMLIEQNETLDKKIEAASNEQEKEGLNLIRSNLDSLLSSIKHAIVLLQIAKVSIKNPPSSSSSGNNNNNNNNSVINNNSSGLRNDKNNKSSLATNTTVAAIAASLHEQQRQHSIDQSSPKPPARSSKKQQLGKRLLQSRLSLSSSSPAHLQKSTPILVSQQSCDASSIGSSSVSSFNSGNLDLNKSYIRVPEKTQEQLQQPQQDQQHMQSQNKQDIHSNSVKVSAAAECTSSTKSIHLASQDGAAVKPDGNDLVNDDGDDVDRDDDDDDDDAFYDADGDQQNSNQNTSRSPSNLINDHQAVTNFELTQPMDDIDSADSNPNTPHEIIESTRNKNLKMPNDNNKSQKSTIPSGVNDEDEVIDWDSLYDDEEEDLGSLESQGSVIKHLISQIRIGMDLTKVVLPTFILERRSLLEMYADFFAHPDLFSSIPDYETPEQRMVQLVKWYLSAFHAGRKSSVAKKPYNPILGEIFLCHWNLNGNDQQKPIERANSNESSASSSSSDIENFSKNLSKDSLLFVAEQVSHHPTVSAFYTENFEKQISCCAHIYTKSKYLGLSVGVHNIGKGVIKLLKHNETYVCTFPSAYGRSILSVPWIELGGSVDITCAETGYSANIEFVTKPFYGGKKHRVIGQISRPNKEPFIMVDGEWNSSMFSKIPSEPDNNKQVFVDTTCLPVIKKHVRSITCQESFESRNVWKEVTRALKMHDVPSATAAKSFIEQRQRDLLKDRMEKGIKWKTRYFEETDDGWAYRKPLEDRLPR